MLPGKVFGGFVKEAITRLDREVAAGNVGYSDVVPGATTKHQVQRELLAPAAVSPDRLARTQRLNASLYKAQLNNPEAATGLKRLRAYGRMFPGMGPATVIGQVYAPEESGRFIRGFAKGNLQGPAISTLSASVPKGAPFHDFAKRVTDAVLPPTAPMDATLNKAILQHEFGEAAMLRGLEKGRTIQPVASHLGVEPIVRENLATLGDPEAQKIMEKIRRREPKIIFANFPGASWKADRGDDTVQRAIRQAGGTPDSPIPLGGKQHRAVERILGRAVKKDPAVLGAGLPRAKMMNRIQQMTGQKVLGYDLPPPVPIRQKIMDVLKARKKSIAAGVIAGGLGGAYLTHRLRRKPTQPSSAPASA